MKLHDIAEKLGFECLTPEIGRDKQAEVTGGHASDLLSDVLANAPSGGVLVTIQVHLNMIAVALHAGLTGVILAANRYPEEAVIRKAVEESIPIYISPRSTFEIVGRLYEMGLRGKSE